MDQTGSMDKFICFPCRRMYMIRIEITEVSYSEDHENIRQLESTTGVIEYPES